jgi:hypothetical protein
MSKTHLFLTYKSANHQTVSYSGKDTGTTRLDLQHFMAQLGFDSQIIEVDGQFTITEAYGMAKQYATRYGRRVITDRENLAWMRQVNKEVDVHKKKVVKAIKSLDIPETLKDKLLASSSDVIENWCGMEQGKYD